MPQDKKESSTVDFLNEISSTKEPFKEDTTSDVDETIEDEKPLPFHKDPKVQRYVEKQIEKAMEKMPKPSAESQFKKDVEEINLPASFIKLVGNDTEEKKGVLKDLSNYFSTLKGEARQEFLEEMKQQEQQQVAEDTAALTELNTGFEQIEEEYGVDLTSDTKTRAAFVEFLRKVSHKNADGEVDQFADIPSTWETFQGMNRSQPASRAKELASRGMTRSADATISSKTGNSWKDVERHFETLKKTIN